MHMDAEIGCEPVELARPLPGDAHRRDDERGARRDAVLPFGDEHRDRLHGLPEAHLVGEDPTRAEIPEQPEPPVAALLEREEVVAHARRRRARLVAALVAVDELGERVVERDAAELEPCLVGLDAGERAGEIDDRGVTPPGVEEAERPLDLGGAEGVPAAAQAHERLLRSGELGELRLGELDVADRDAPVEPRERVS